VARAIVEAHLDLAEPEFELFKRYTMTIRDGETVLASASLRLVKE
jgi:hypothetical protein